VDPGGISETAVTSAKDLKQQSVVANQLQTGENNGDDSYGSRQVEAATNSAEERAQDAVKAQGR
jgi:hypothetical protein